jgi:nucleoside-diphosphate-sugar epimerase
MNFQGRKIALIGGAGFIGHHLALACRNQGAEVSVIDSLSINSLTSFIASPAEESHRSRSIQMIQERLRLLERSQISLHTVDARDAKILVRTLELIKPDTILFLAGISHAERANKDPRAAFEHGLVTLENTLDYSQRGLAHFVYFSSSMVYGDFPEGGATEDTPCKPVGVYGVLKLAGEKFVKARHESEGLPYTIIRPSALYGERCVSRRVGQVFIESALMGNPVSIKGSGEDRLDFTYIEDLIQGTLLVLSQPRAKNEIFNLTYGESRSIADLAETLKVYFPKTEIQYGPKDFLMPKRGTLHIEKAKSLLGYFPRYPLEVGFQKYIRWYQL